MATPPIAVEQTAKNATNRVKALLEENRKLRGELAALREEKKTSKLVTPKSGDLVVLKNTIKKIDKDGNSSLEGVVVNRTHLKMVNVNIHFNCLDQEGFRIGDVFSAVETLDPGEQWKFRTTSLEDNTASWKFQRLEGYKAGEFFATAHAGKEE